MELTQTFFLSQLNFSKSGGVSSLPRYAPHCQAGQPENMPKAEEKVLSLWGCNWLCWGPPRCHLALAQPTCDFYLTALHNPHHGLENKTRWLHFHSLTLLKAEVRTSTTLTDRAPPHRIAGCQSALGTCGIPGCAPFLCDLQKTWPGLSVVLCWKAKICSDFQASTLHWHVFWQFSKYWRVPLSLHRRCF